MKPILILVAVVAAVVVLLWLGLKVTPTPFPAFPQKSQSLDTVPLPSGLPAPVERFYREVYGEQVPVIHSVVISGRATIRPIANIPLPSRFRFIHDVGRSYRHYFESTFYNLPFLKVNEGILNGNSFFEAPVGTYHNDPNTNQGANLALWAEAAWFPSVLVTDPRVHWAPVDEQTALLYVPFEDQQETFVVRFNPQTHMIDKMEAMRYRNPGDTAKILWITQNIEGEKIAGTKLDRSGSATWMDQGKPWATFTLEDVRYNVDVQEYIQARGQ